ncbi:MAG: nucleotidyl transferase AbiEii/AbiGii toxin family protein [Euryarchaeota archaeon]|nr:nucleotidyl transferase AbiEii/AbiGii toxin family protein [Euryarchaeota archaeon]
MIPKEDLIRIARLNGLRAFQQEKHYIQTMVLRSIYSTTNDLAFKGGTCLWLFHGLNRFSEDLDFTMRTGKEMELKNLPAEVEKDLELYGIDSEIRVINDNEISFSFRIGAKGPLFTREIERSFVRIEISKRENIIKQLDVLELDANYMDILPFFVVLMNKDEILAEKVRAILTRNRARDVYDLWFLLKKEARFDLNLINEKLKYYNRLFEKVVFMERVRGMEQYWESELKPLVIGRLPHFEAVYRDVEEMLRDIM